MKTTLDSQPSLLKLALYTTLVLSVPWACAMAIDHQEKASEKKCVYTRMPEQEDLRACQGRDRYRTLDSCLGELGYWKKCE